MEAELDQVGSGTICFYGSEGTDFSIRKPVKPSRAEHQLHLPRRNWPFNNVS